MSASIGDAFGSYKSALLFLFSKPLPVLSDFAKVAGLGLAVQLLLGIATLGIAAVTGADLESGDIPSLEFLAAAIVLAVPAVILNTALNATPYHLVDERAAGRSGDVVRKTLGLLFPMARYLLVASAIFLGLFAATLVLGALGGMLDPLIGILAVLAGAFSMMAALFVLQFAIPEIALRGAGPVESIRRSWRIISKNLVAVIAFDILLVAAAMFFWMLFGLFGQAGASLMPGGDLAVFAYTVVVTLANNMATAMVFVMPYYFFWKMLAAPAVEAPAVKEQPKPKPVAKRKARRKKR